MTTITIERELLEQALAALETMTDEYDDSAVGLEIEAIHALRAALSAPATAPEQMPLERDCICHQDLHLDAYSGGAAPEGIYGALWVVVEGVRKKYVLADQSSEPKDMPAPATAPEQRMKELEAEVERLRKDAERYRGLAECLMMNLMTMQSWQQRP